jgi:hypothetical protein
MHRVTRARSLRRAGAAASIVAAAVAATAVAEARSSAHPASTSPSRLAPIHGRYAPDIDPAEFGARIDNRWFPLRPGTRFAYRGVAEDGRTRQRDIMVVTHLHKRIMGVRVRVVRDSVYQHGHRVELTHDWYAQDRAGNVWYMGELALELHHGRLVKAGDSWQGGVNGAQPGIIMPAHPRRGQRYRQEFFPGHAMDQARVLGDGGPVSEPAGTFRHTLLTVETAPTLEPGVAERKWYVAGVGDVEEHTVSGDKEHIRLVRVTH